MLTQRLLYNITPRIEMRRKVIYSLKLEIYRGAGEIVDYRKALTSPPGMFISIEEFKQTLRNVNKNS